jgi:error-prone DNA polymerase
MQTLPRSRPRTFEDLVVEVAIIRPGPIQGNAVNPYLRRRAGKEAVTYLHPALEPILRETLGVILFQEQILRIAMEVAGFTAGEADRFRRAMNRHRSRIEMETLRDGFLAGLERHQVPRAVGEELFKAVAGFAEFGFCKSHAAAFARTCYETAWLKLTYPAPFYAGLLNHQPMGFYAPHVLVEDAKRHGVRVLPVDINRSQGRCRVEGADVRLGFNYVQHVGDKALECLEDAARTGPYRSLEAFVQRARLPRNAVESLILAGAFDAFGPPRRRLLWELPQLLQRLDRAEILTEPVEPAALPAMTPMEVTATDYRLLGLTTGPHLITYYRPHFDAIGVVPTNALRALPPRRLIRVGGLVITRQAPATAHKVRFFTLADEHGHIDVTLRQDVYQRYRRVANREPVLVIDGILQRGDGGVTSVLAQRVTAPPRPTGMAADPVSHDYH